MIIVNDNKMRLSRGDFGVMIPVELIPDCRDSEIDLLDSDVVRLEIQQDGVPLVVREKTWAELKETEAVMPLELTAEESESMPVGVYAWAVYLLRAQDMRMTLLRSALEVVE